MKNRVLGIAVAAAALGVAMPGMQPLKPSGLNAIAPHAQGSTQAPQGGIGTLLQAMLAYGNARGYGYRKPTYGGRGHSVAHGQRMARKRRNQLRAKGQYRKAVR